MELGLYNNLSVLKPYIAEPATTLLIGKAKTGKSNLLEQIALTSYPFVFIGNAEKMLASIPKKLQKRVLYFNPSAHPFSFNVLHNVPLTLQPLVSSTLTQAIISLSGFSIEPVRLKKYLSFGIQTLLNANDNYTFLDLKRLLTDDAFRTKVIGQVSDPVLKDFWNDYEQLPLRDRLSYIESTLTRLYSVLLEPQIRSCLGQKHNRLVFKDTIVLVSLSEAYMGKDNANLLGSLILAMLYVEGVQGLETRLFVDDAYRFPFLEAILSRCPSITTVYTLQYLSQMKNPVSDRIVAFRTTVKDGESLDLGLTNDQLEVHKINDFEAYTQAGSGAIRLTIPHYQFPDTGQAQKIINRCRTQCSAPQEVINKRLGSMFNG